MKKCTTSVKFRLNTSLHYTKYGKDKSKLSKNMVLSSEWVVKIRTRVLQATNSKHAGARAEQYTTVYSVLKGCFTHNVLCKS